jgi:hypothetical protein
MRNFGDNPGTGESIIYLESFYKHQTVYFATKHDKTRLLQPLFAAHGIGCVALEVDTDEFGTFTGEVERVGGVRETLRKKINAALRSSPETRLLLASEGSFGPHPVFGFSQTDLESLLFVDRKLGIEIYAEFLGTEPNHAERAFGPLEDFRTYLTETGFPAHGVIVRTEGFAKPVFKGLHSEYEVLQAMHDCFSSQPNHKVMISSDLRANHSPSRQMVIQKAGEKLIEKLNSICPGCGSPGFAISRGVPGLICIACKEPSGIAKQVLFECVKCDFNEIRSRPDGKTHIEPDECENCNP